MPRRKLKNPPWHFLPVAKLALFSLAIHGAGGTEPLCFFTFPNLVVFGKMTEPL